MKKILLILALTLVLLTGCSAETNYTEVETVQVDMSGYENMPVVGHQFLKTTPQEVLKLIEEGGSAVVYYGYSTCPFCNKATSVINDAAKELDMNVLYVDVHPEITNDESYLDEYYDEFYYDFDKAMDDTTIAFSKFLSLDEDGEPEFYVPNVLVIKNGKVLGNHVALVDSYAGGGLTLTINQYNELLNIYKGLMKKLD
jgi:predicted bacteriocin transport accessory protein